MNATINKIVQDNQKRDDSFNNQIGELSDNLNRKKNSLTENISELNQIIHNYKLLESEHNKLKDILRRIEADKSNGDRDNSQKISDYERTVT